MRAPVVEGYGGAVVGAPEHDIAPEQPPTEWRIAQLCGCRGNVPAFRGSSSFIGQAPTSLSVSGIRMSGSHCLRRVRRR